MPPPNKVKDLPNLRKGLKCWVGERDRNRDGERDRERKREREREEKEREKCLLHEAQGRWDGS